jgi:nucleoside-diphosphate-sugar epimerase
VSVLAITGASGFIGMSLLDAIAAGHYSEVRLLAHRNQPVPLPAAVRVINVTGSLLDPASLRALLAPGCAVIHLAYLAAPRRIEDNVTAARNLAAACRDARIRRMIHCSTAVVAGSAPGDVVTENTPCQPTTEYERAKYRIEQEMRESAAGNHEITILRPTVVFGPGGRNLISQARRIARGSAITNLLYSALQGRRRMNLVSVHNVAAALAFLAAADRRVDQQSYIVSDDEHASNNYRDVASILARELGCGHLAGRFKFPSVFLETALRARGRSNLNLRRIYSDHKLRGAGFSKPWSFDAALLEFAKWVGTQYGLGGGARR